MLSKFLKEQQEHNLSFYREYYEKELDALVKRLNILADDIVEFNLNQLHFCIKVSLYDTGHFVSSKFDYRNKACRLALDKVKITIIGDEYCIQNEKGTELFKTPEEIIKEIGLILIANTEQRY